MKKTSTPSIKVTIILHSFGETSFEIMDIALIDSRYDELMNLYHSNTQDFEKYVDELCYLDAIREMTCEELGNYGETSKEINKILWNKNLIERYYCINVSLWYEDKQDYFGEIDTNVEYEYELSSFEKEWDKLDLLQKGDKIYYIDFEESGASYTVLGILEVYNNKFQKTGIYYNVHSDNLSNATGYYTILDEMVDSDNIQDRFFSTPELAHNAYLKFKNLD